MRGDEADPKEKVDDGGRPDRKAYSPPRIEDEAEFDTVALGCALATPEDCFENPSAS